MPRSASRPVLKSVVGSAHLTSIHKRARAGIPDKNFDSSDDCDVAADEDEAYQELVQQSTAQEEQHLDAQYRLSNTISHLVRHIHELRQKVLNLLASQDEDLAASQQREEYTHKITEFIADIRLEHEKRSRTHQMWADEYRLLSL